MKTSETSKILKEWKSFLNESNSKKFKRNHVDKKVFVKDCCGKCFENFGIDKKYNSKTGTLKEINLNDRDNVNFVLVSIDNDEKQFPECCVNLKK